MKSITSKRLSKKNFIAIAVTLSLLLAGGIVYAATRPHGDPTDPQPTSKPSTSKDDATADGVKSSAADSPVENVNTAADTKSNTTNNRAQTIDKTKTSVVIVDAAQYGETIEVRAYANEVSASGTCTFTFSKGDATVVRGSASSPSAQTTSCATLTMPVSAFATRGDWSLVVKYASSSSNGESDAKTVTVK